MELGYGTLRIRYRETATNLSNVVYIEYDIIKTLLRNAITIILTGGEIFGRMWKKERRMRWESF
jgi:hypothetical protein